MCITTTSSDASPRATPQAGYEITVNLPGSDTIRIVRTQYELVEDNTVLDTADMGEEQALEFASHVERTKRRRTS